MFVKKILFGLLLLVGHWFVEADEALTVNLTTTVYPPYHDPQLNKGGFQHELVVEAFKRTGYKANIEYLVWSRALRETRKGNYDGILGLWMRSERLKDFEYSEPIGTNSVVFFKRKDNPVKFEKYTDLKNYTIGVVRGYVNPKEIDNADYLTKEVLDNNLQALKMLVSGRIDLAVLDKNVGEYLVKRYLVDDKDKLEWVSPIENKEVQYIGFSRNSSQCSKTLQAFNLGLEKIKQDGTYARILHKHGISE